MDLKSSGMRPIKCRRWLGVPPLDTATQVQQPVEPSSRLTPTTTTSTTTHTNRTLSKQELDDARQECSCLVASRRATQELENRNQDRKRRRPPARTGNWPTHCWTKMLSAAPEVMLLASRSGGRISMLRTIVVASLVLLIGASLAPHSQLQRVAAQASQAELFNAAQEFGPSSNLLWVPSAQPEEVAQRSHRQQHQPVAGAAVVAAAAAAATADGSFGSRLPEGFTVDSQFASRQGQLARAQTQRLQMQPVAAGLQRRPAPARPQLDQFTASGGQFLDSQQDNATPMQSRFQRLRPQQASADSFSPTSSGPNFGPSSLQLQRQFQQQPNNQLNAPRLSAFDLSSLANLANQAQFGPLPPQSMNGASRQQQQQVPNPLAFNTATGNFQQPQSGANGQNGELPFIRQVFRPTSEQVQAGDAANQAQPGPRVSSRPTPPPLFVPGRPIVNANTGNNKLTTTINANNNNRIVETGFTPVQIGANGLSSSRGVFFEPASSGFNSASQNAANNQRPLANTNQISPSRGQDQGAAPATSEQQQTQRRKPQVVRRPSQRPSLPAQQQQATNDVIRLATNAIQATNEGLAAINQPQPLPPTRSINQPLTTALNDDSSTPLSAAISSTSPSDLLSLTASTEPTQAASATTTTSTTTQASTTGLSAVDSSASSLPASSGNRAVNELSASISTAVIDASTLEPSSGFSSISSPDQARRPAGIPLKSSSANFFTLTGTANPTPATFSPALPINMAVATGGRRRIPVRVQTPQPGQATRPQAATTTTSSTTQPPVTSTGGRQQVTGNRQTSSSFVRVPSLEDFYETIVGGQNVAQSGPANIAGFGSPSGGGASQPSTLKEQLETTPSADLYGSRLQPASEEPQKKAGASSEVSASTSDAAVAVPQAAAPVLVQVTYLTTLTYLTTVVHGTHTLETSHESVVRSTELATLNAQLLDQIERQRPLIEPTATVPVSSRTKGKGTTIVNLKSAVNALNQELVEALGVETALNTPKATTHKPQRPLVRATRTLGLHELQEARKSLVTEYQYLYTLRPLDGSPASTSVRVEQVSGSANPMDLLLQLQQAGSGGGGAGAQLIDSKGSLRVGSQDTQPGASELLLGSLPDPALATELNVHTATYIKFADITNVLVDLRPTSDPNLGSLGSPHEPQQPPTDLVRATGPASLLDTSFSSNLGTLSGGHNQLHTPALDMPTTGVVPSATVDPQEPHQQARPSVAPAGSLTRSQLRSRIASSRFRSQLQSVAQVSGAGAAPSSAAAPSSQRPASTRPIKSRIVRPLRGSASQPEAGSTAAVAAANNNGNATSISLVQASPSRSTKPRFVVVTRTGQFGIRASAISSLASQAAEAAASAASASSLLESPSASTSSSVSRAGSRFSKTVRFRGGSSTMPKNIITAAATEQPTTVVAPTSISNPLQQDSTAISVAPPSTATSATAEPASSSSDSSVTSTPALDTPTNPDAKLEGGVKLDGSASIVVTYFTTTTHTIPFTINSDLIFTTIEETNSRVATEVVRDLGTHFIEPTPAAASTTTPSSAAVPSSPVAGSGSPTTENDTEKLPGTISISSEQQESSTAPTAPLDNSLGVQKAATGTDAKSGFNSSSNIETVNTRTYFTTFTYFTTLSSEGSTPTVQSSESTTSNVVLETVTSTGGLIQPTQTLEPLATSPMFTTPPTGELMSSPVAPTTSEPSTTETNGDRAVTTSSLLDIQPSTKGIETTLVDSNGVQATATLDQVNKITRTRSLYTTLTHYITFYSGTKTQLSTIQEISPTVVTEYIDRTEFEASSTTTTTMATPSSEQTSSSTSTQPSTQPELTSTRDSSSTTTDSKEPVAAASSEPASLSDAASLSTTTTTTASTTTVTPSSPQPDTTTVSRAGAQAPESVQVTKSEDTGIAESFGESKSAPEQAPNIIELSDLIAANSSAGGRVALTGNLGAAIKDIVQLLAGNKTSSFQMNPQHTDTTETSSEPTTDAAATTLVTASSSSQPATSTTTSSTTTTSASTTTTAGSSTTAGLSGRRATVRLYGQKAREQLQGSMVAPSAGDLTTTSGRSTPELAVPPRTNQQQQQQPTATIFFGDDGGDERKKPVKSVWPASQATVFITSIEPSTRSLTLTTTRVYYTRDAPFTVTSSYATLIAPRTFVSTIMGTRTLVNQLHTQSALPVNGGTPAPTSGAAQARQDSQASGHRLAVLQKQQKQQQQVIEQQNKLARVQPIQSINKPARQQRIEQHPTYTSAAANINQCQPSCKQSLNEICRFQPHSDTGAQGSFVCACRPGYQLVLNKVGQRQCQEVQSYTLLLRLIQVGDQQVAYRRELQDRGSAEYKQYAKLVREHVKRAYLSSELTRERFVGADVVGYSRSLAAGMGSFGGQEVGVTRSGNSSLSSSNNLDQLNAGLIVNVTIQLQPSTAGSSQFGAGSSASPAGGVEALDETALKEELSKNLNMRQAAALAAAAANRATHSTSGSADTSGQAETSLANINGPTTANDEPLPNPNALFLADVEQVSDLDECASSALNDCHEAATCINEPGSYRCDCRDYPDMNPLQPGRQCGSEIKSCDYCNSRGDCLRVTSSLNSANNITYNHRQSPFTTVCQCHRFYLGRRCEINGLLLACLLPILAILLFISICLVVYCCRRWRKRTALSKSFRNIGTFGPNMIGGTLDRKAMLESSSESSDTHQRAHNLRPPAIYDSNSADPSSGASSNESSPRQMLRNQVVGPVDAGYHLPAAQAASGAAPTVGPYCSSMPPQIVIPRARHNQVNYAVHRGQVYMW